MSGGGRDRLDRPLGERTAAKILRHAAVEFGDKPFVTCAGEQVSFGEADRRANRVANAFTAMGIGRGDRVGLLLENRLEYLDLWFGLARIGAVELPINPDCKRQQIAHALGRASAPVVVTQASRADELLAALAETSGVRLVVCLDGPLQPDAGAPFATLDYAEAVLAADDGDPACAKEPTGADLGAIMNTSGTTGLSKGVLLSHGQQYWLGRNMARALSLGPDDVYYNFFPLFHNTAQAMITLPSLLSGARMVLRDRFSLSGFWSDVRAHRCTAFYYIGEILHLLVCGTRAEDAEGSTLRVAWGIGATPADMATFAARFGVALGTGYGSTEANVPVFRAHGSGKAGSAGYVLPEFELRIGGADDEALPAGEVGEVLVRSREPYTLMLGYDGNPAATVEATRNLWLHTGDAGYLDADGEFFFVTRLKDVIRVRGENVSPAEVEEVVAACDGVAEAAAVAVPAEIGGDDVKVVVVAEVGARIDFPAMLTECRRRLPRYAVPRYFEVVEALPKTETSKIRKHVLRQTPFTQTTWCCASGRYLGLGADPRTREPRFGE